MICQSPWTLTFQPADAVAGWQAQFDAAMRQKKELADDAAATQARMDSANALLSALAGEEGRWTAQSQAFDTTIQRLTGGLLGLAGAALVRTLLVCDC